MTENSMQNNRKNRDPETRSGHGLPFGDPRDVAEVGASLNLRFQLLPQWMQLILEKRAENG